MNTLLAHLHSGEWIASPSLLAVFFVLRASEGTSTWREVSFHESLSFCSVSFCWEFCQHNSVLPNKAFSLISLFSLMSDIGKDNCLWEGEHGAFAVTKCLFFTIYHKIQPPGVQGEKGGHWTWRCSWGWASAMKLKHIESWPIITGAQEL